ncbi:hypothetical protein B0T24DRAFT_681899 [Lasiosphaeria ovina]|uniref:DUF7924 domain-containing protein n=1 Tax=Lasiosphaeria ovina TaxID=92902 RepID=A0AAE0JYI0_9PEZI|nr:hypothetical protein B0T24DRAFT_681899 [Lasiosphaeria ovina]
MEKLVQTTLQQPKPKPLEHPHALSLKSEVKRLEQVSPATRLRKRQISSDGNDKHQPKLARLMRRNLTLFNKITKKMGANKASARLDSTAESSTTQAKTISTTSSGLETQATKNGILLSSNSKPPENAKGLVDHLNRSRRTASPTESVYEDYVNTVTKVANEATTSHETAPLLKGYRDRGYSRAWNQAFTAYPKNVGFNNGLSAPPQPDFVQGFRQLEFEPFPVSEELDSAVLFNDDQNSLALPHFAGEWKGPGNDMDQAALRSAYDGAALVHSRNEALAYMGKSDPAGHASVLTVTTDGRAVNVFGHYAAPSAGGDKPKYHQYRLTTAHMDESYDDFKKGRKQLRNAQDFAREQSHHLKNQLQEHWKTSQARASGPSLLPRDFPLPTVESTLPLDHLLLPAQPDPDGDEEAGYEVTEPACMPTPHTSSKTVHQAKHNMGASHSSSHSAVASPRSRDYASRSSHKRKASSSSSQLSKSSKDPGYWQLDEVIDHHFHVHRDGACTWGD